MKANTATATKKARLALRRVRECLRPASINAIIPARVLDDSVIASGQRSFAQPTRAFTFRQRDAKRRAKRGAEAPGQRTARGRLLRRVSQRFEPKLGQSTKRDDPDP